MKQKQWEVGGRAGTTPRNGPQGIEKQFPGEVLTGEGDGSIREKNKSSHNVSISTVISQFTGRYVETAAASVHQMKVSEADSSFRKLYK